MGTLATIAVIVILFFISQSAKSDEDKANVDNRIMLGIILIIVFGIVGGIIALLINIF